MARIDEVRCDLCDKVIHRIHLKDSLWNRGNRSSYSLNLNSKGERITNVFDLCQKCFYKTKKGLIKQGFKFG